MSAYFISLLMSILRWYESSFYLQTHEIIKRTKRPGAKIGISIVRSFILPTHLAVLSSRPKIFRRSLWVRSSSYRATFTASPESFSHLRIRRTVITYAPRRIPKPTSAVLNSASIYRPSRANPQMQTASNRVIPASVPMIASIPYYRIVPYECNWSRELISLRSVDYIEVFEMRSSRNIEVSDQIRSRRSNL